MNIRLITFCTLHFAFCIVFLTPCFAKEPDIAMRERFDAFKQAVRQQKNPDKADAGISARQVRRSVRSTDGTDVRLRPGVNTPLEIRVKSPNRDSRKALPRTEDENTAREFLRQTRHVLGIADPDNELNSEKKQEDDLGHRHLRFSQKFRNIPVWPAQLNVHLNAFGNTELLNGAFVPTPRKMVTKPVITADEAIVFARKRVVGADNAKAGTPELIIYAPGDTPSRLAWKTDLDISPSSRWLVVTDAQTGDTLTAYNQIPDDRVAGSGTDIFGVSRPLNVWEKDGKYYLADTSKPMYNASSDPPSVTSTFGAIVILDMGNNSPDSNPRYVTAANPKAGWNKDAVSAAFCLSETYNYFQERHNRNSIDDKGSTIFGVIRVGDNYDNAFWNSENQMMYFGDGEAYAGALDVVAHEMTHGVTSYTANLVYQDQPGALNEAFSDIFGEAAEARTTGKNDWLLGTTLSEPIRNIANPSSEQIGNSGRYYPSKMSQYFGKSDSFLDRLQNRDNGGVHINSTIIGRAFYLLSEGMTGAIGIRDAEKIFYRALSFHLVNNSQFIDARLACIASAQELFGQGSNQAAKTAAAFDAVEITDGSAAPTQPPASIPAVSANDSVLFVYYDTKLKGNFLGRREGSDPAQGVPLSYYDVKPSRASVARDGDFAVFANTSNDTCFILTDGKSKETCMGWNDTYSVAMSRDSELFGFVFLDMNTGQPIDKIAIFNLKNDIPDKDAVRIFDLVAPTFDGVSTNTILQADTMSFSVNNKYIVYDAFNVIKLADGSGVGAWSLYSIDLTTNQTMVVMPPVRGTDIGYPMLSQTSDNFVTFDAFDTQTKRSTVYAMNLVNGDRKPIVQVNGDWGAPCYTGDDKAIVYSDRTSGSSAYSLWRQPVSDDHISPAGTPAPYLENADFGTIYRRAVNQPTPTPQPQPQPSPPADDSAGGGCFINTIIR